MTRGALAAAPERRSAAAVTLCRAGFEEHRPSVRRLLLDPDPDARRRVAFALLALKEKPAIPVLIGNGLMIQACWFAAMGIRRFYGLSISWRPGVLITAGTCAMLAFFLFVDENMPVRILIYSAGQSIPTQGERYRSTAGTSRRQASSAR